MTTKAKLVSTIAAFCLVLALMVVGVLAASTVTVNLGGTIGFQSSDVVGSVTIATSGAATDLVATGEGNRHEFDSATADNTHFDFTNKALNFKAGKANNTITVTLTITNNSKERAIKVAYTTELNITSAKNVEIQNVQFTNGESAKSFTQGSTFNIEPADEGQGETGRAATITFNIVRLDANYSVAGSWAGLFTLTNAAATTAPGV